MTSAGIAIPGYFEDIPVEVFERTMAVNYLGTVYVVKAAVPAHESGRRTHRDDLFGRRSHRPLRLYSLQPHEIRAARFRRGAARRASPPGHAVSIAYPPDTETPQLIEEQKTKPAETAHDDCTRGACGAPKRSPARIVRDIARGTFAITPGFELTALHRFGSAACAAGAVGLGEAGRAHARRGRRHRYVDT